MMVWFWLRQCIWPESAARLPGLGIANERLDSFGTTEGN